MELRKETPFHEYICILAIGELGSLTPWTPKNELDNRIVVVCVCVSF